LAHVTVQESGNLGIWESGTSTVSQHNIPKQFEAKEEEVVVEEGEEDRLKSAVKLGSGEP